MKTLNVYTCTHTRVYIVCLCLHAPMWKSEQGAVCCPVLCSLSQFLRQISEPEAHSFGQVG